MLRRAIRADAEVMAAIHAAAFATADTWSAETFGLQLAMPNNFGLLHQEGGMILARVAADEAEILTLAVVPTARGAGLGSTLLAAAIDLAVSLSARAIFLEVSVANIAARALYTKAGFIQTGHRRRYYSDTSDALVLRLDVRPSS
jgi:[ribosomal protein S18]-alanine N-acetyltransferase